MVLIFVSYPALAKALPSSNTRMHSMLGMSNLLGGQFKGFLLLQLINWIGTISGATDWQQTTLNRSPSLCPESSPLSSRFSFSWNLAHQVLQNFQNYFFESRTNFQDDLFPPTRVLWQSSCSGARWLAGELGAALWVGQTPLWIIQLCTFYSIKDNG